MKLNNSGYFRIFLSTLVIFTLACSSNDNQKIALKEVPERLSNQEAEIGIYNAALNAFDRGIYSVALRHIKLFKDSYPLSKLTQHITLKEADTYFYSGQFTEASAIYQEYIRNYPTHDGNSYALYMLGRTHLEQYKDAMRDQEPLKLAVRSFEKLRKEHPGSELNSQVDKYLNEILEEQASHELNVASYYIEAGELEPAAGRVAILNQNYPESNARKNLTALLAELEVDQRLQLLALSETIPVNELDGFITEFKNKSNSLDIDAELARTQPRFRLEAPEANSLMEDESNVDELKNSGSGLLGDLHCKQMGEWAVFSIGLNRFETYEVIVSNSVSKSESDSFITNRISFTSSNSNLEVNDSKTCSIAGKKLLAREVSKTEDETVVDIGIISSEMLESAQTETIVLDRPNRLITLVRLN